MNSSNAWKRFLKRKVSVVAGIVAILIVIIALIGPMFCTQDPYKQDLLNINKGPSAEHILGTDYLGRDTFTRIIYGARVSLGVAFAGVLLGSCVGVLLGICAGFFGGWFDSAVNALVTVLQAFPGMLLAILVVAILGTGTVNTAITIAIYTVPGLTRLVRSNTVQLKNNEYIEACRIMGASNAHILFCHIVPNAMSQIIVNITLSLGTSILTSSGLSFLGLGVQPPEPEWGSMLNYAKDYVRIEPIGVLSIGITITIVVMSFSLLGDGLRDALDPKLKNKT